MKNKFRKALSVFLTLLIILSIVLSIVLIILLMLIICFFIIPAFNVGITQTGGEETFLMASNSPNGIYCLEAYKTEPGATVDFSVRVYIVNDNQKNIIYDAYHEYNAEIIWIDDSVVSINGKTLDLSRGEKYDWRKQ